MAVTLTGNSPYLAKDQRKADIATKFIGRGSNASSTARYALCFGALANCGSYDKKDVVFVSAEGNRGGRIPADLEELQHAIDAGATIVTDSIHDRMRPYNVGEREVAQYLNRHGYHDTGTGVWKKEI